MAITLGEAARLTGPGKTTLARAIKAGRLSATQAHGVVLGNPKLAEIRDRAHWPLLGGCLEQGVLPVTAAAVLVDVLTPMGWRISSENQLCQR
jgi:hypothetical protein